MLHVLFHILFNKNTQVVTSMFHCTFLLNSSFIGHIMKSGKWMQFYVAGVMDDNHILFHQMLSRETIKAKNVKTRFE
jgi:hypothetical protein